MSMRRIALIYAPFSGGSGVAGCELAPAALREAGLERKLQSAGRRASGVALDLRDCGTAAEATLEQLLVAYRRVSAAVMTALAGDELPVVLGGDHGLAIGSVAGVARHCRRSRRPLWVLWFDAHADFNTFATSPSGNVHGMPAAVVCGLGDPRLLALSGEAPWVTPARMRQIGVRAVDAGESELLRSHDVCVTGMLEVRRRGLTSVVEAVLAQVAADNGHLHVSLDIDAMDPAAAPGVDHPEPDGLAPDAMKAALRTIAASGLLGSVDVMELNPLRDSNGKTAQLAVELVGSLLGNSAETRLADEEVCDENAAYGT